jgi:hypothetical protein
MHSHDQLWPLHSMNLEHSRIDRPKDSDSPRLCKIVCCRQWSEASSPVPQTRQYETHHALDPTRKTVQRNGNHAARSQALQERYRR